MPFANRAEWLEFMSQGGTVDTKPLAVAYPEEEFVGFVSGALATVERVSFRSGDLVLRGILVHPAGEGPFPAVVYARGGNREYGKLRFLDVMRMLAIAGSGRVVLAPEYRGEGGSEGEPELGRGDVDDVIASVEALTAWSRAETGSLSLVGSSRGGLVAAWALTRDLDFDAAVLVAPSLDLEASAERRPELDAAVYAKSVAGYADDRVGALRRASPIHAVDRMAKTPILLLHGTADWRVHASVSLELSHRLLERDHPHRLVILEGGNHSLTNHALWVRQQIESWLSAYASGEG
ncbi:MAG: prolyl oligopeptidase family serine peptidase [Holophagales bacterium]|nr:prolyl oligopeptidase family serine peptidase [Holophagales bacterium]